MITIEVYRLTDANGTKRYAVTNDPSSNGCIGGFDVNGNYQQYDSSELYYAYEWAAKHGFKLEVKSHELDVESLFNNS